MTTGAEKARYELHHDKLDDTYTIHRVEKIGPFEDREAARQYMLDTEGIRNGTDALCRVPMELVDAYLDWQECAAFRFTRLGDGEVGIEVTNDLDRLTDPAEAPDA